MGKRALAALAVATLLVLFAACGEGSEDASEMSAPSGNAAAPESAVGPPGTRGADVRDGGAAADQAGAEGLDEDLTESSRLAQAPLPDLPDAPIAGSGRVIKNISLQIRIKKDEFQNQFSRAGSLAEQFGGFVTNSQVSETDGEFASGSLTIRIPSNRFEEAIGRLKSLGKVTAEDRSGQDVSKEFIDLEARLRQAKTEEAFFLRLMEQAKGISDLIQVQSQLSGIQLRIEQIQGQLNYYQDQTAFSTVSVRLYEPGAPESGNPQPLTEAWDRAVDGFQSVIGGLVVAVGWLAPFALFGLVALVVFKLRRRPKAPGTPESTTPDKTGGAESG